MRIIYGRDYAYNKKDAMIILRFCSESTINYSHITFSNLMVASIWSLCRIWPIHFTE